MDMNVFKDMAQGYRHFCYITDDIDKSLKLFELMGAQGLDKNYAHGRAMVFALAELGNGTQVEIVQPLEAGTTYAEFLSRHGPGIHHVAFRVSNFDAVYDELVSQGYTVVQEGRGEFRGRTVNMAYIDCTPIGAPMIELAGITEPSA
jgi:catechol 2,3-dioxygenase-like lactoylglutathione lyase family enzyme